MNGYSSIILKHLISKSRNDKEDTLDNLKKKGSENEKKGKSLPVIKAVETDEKPIGKLSILSNSRIRLHHEV